MELFDEMVDCATAAGKPWIGGLLGCVDGLSERAAVAGRRRYDRK